MGLLLFSLGSPSSHSFLCYLGLHMGFENSHLSSPFISWLLLVSLAFSSRVPTCAVVPLHVQAETASSPRGSLCLNQLPPGQELPLIHTQGGAKVGLQLFVWRTIQCLISHNPRINCTHDWKPTRAPPGIHSFMHSLITSQRSHTLASQVARHWKYGDELWAWRGSRTSGRDK